MHGGRDEKPARPRVEGGRLVQSGRRGYSVANGSPASSARSTSRPGEPTDTGESMPSSRWRWGSRSASALSRS